MTVALNVLNARILVVDDQLANVKLLEYMLQGAGYTDVTSCMDSREVPELYRQRRFDAVLLDLNMPHMNGFQVLEALAPIESDGYLPVLVVTAEPGHKLRALQAGAKDFVSKPIDQLEVLTRVRNLLEVRLLHKHLRNQNEVLETRVRERTADVQASHRETIVTMMRAAEYKDTDTGMHVHRISHFCGEIASRLGMPAAFRDQIFYASPMHDIGKIAIPDEILLKPRGFTREEWDVMKRHTTMGAEILAGSRSPYLTMGAEIALHHHERWDGGGYPGGIAGEAIPLAARIMNICDVYDALRSKRPYKPALDHEQTMHTITRGDGRTAPGHFDPEVFRVFADNGAVFRDIYESLA